MTGWRYVLPDLCRGIRQVHLLGADPGAMSILNAVEPDLRRYVASGRFFVEGWAAGAARPVTSSVFTLEMIDSWQSGTALWLGARMDFGRSREIMRRCHRCGIKSFFLFDHWKNYIESFLDETGECVVPDHILVPDTLAQEGLVAAWSGIPSLAAALPLVRVHVFGHPAIEASAARIQKRMASLPPTSTPSPAAFFLDPYPSGGDYGYDVPSVIAFLADWLPVHRPGVRVLIKMHPRQVKPFLVEDFAQWQAKNILFELVDEPFEELVVRSGEVWGMTSVVLLIALAACRSIISFQPGRNRAGEYESNLHLERHVVL